MSSFKNCCDESVVIENGVLVCKYCEEIGGTLSVSHYNKKNPEKSLRDKNGTLMATYVKNKHILTTTVTNGTKEFNKIIYPHTHTRKEILTISSDI